MSFSPIDSGNDQISSDSDVDEWKETETISGVILTGHEEHIFKK